MENIEANIALQLSPQLETAINASLSPQLKASVFGLIGRGVKEVRLSEAGELIFIMSDGKEINLGKLPMPPLPIASADRLGCVKIGENLIIKDGVLSVDTAARVEQDNTKPVTSGAVHTEIGNIEVLLSKL